jgi:pimeloyl-CoA synthetase
MNESNVYIFNVPEITGYERMTQFKEIAQDMNKTVVLEKTFYQRNGEPVFLIYKVLDKN